MKIRPWLAWPDVGRVVLLVLLAAALVVLRSPGSPGLDAQLRLASARWLWAGTSPDTVTDIPAGQLDLFLLRGREGRPHVWFGAGQQMILAPADAALAAVGSCWPVSSPAAARQRHRVAVAVTVFPAVLAAAAAALYALARSLSFSPPAAFWSVALVLAGSPVARYTAEGFETGEEVVYLALALVCVMRHVERPAWWSVAGMVIFPAMMVLLRLPHAAIYGGLGIWLVLVRADRPALRWVGVVAWLGLSLAVAIAADRAFQWWRFGDIATTYSHAAQVQWGAFYGQPVEFFGGGLAAGLWHEFFGAGKSLFLYHPMTLLLVPAGGALIAARRWGWWRSERGAAVVAVAALLAVDAVFYGRYFFAFDTQSWGNRYLEAPLVVGLTVMLAWMIDGWATLARWVRVVVVSVAVWAAVLMTAAGSVTYQDEMALGSRAFPIVPHHTEPPLEVEPLYDDFSFGRRAIIVGRYLAGMEATPADATPFAPAYLPFQLAARLADDPARAWIGRVAISGWLLGWAVVMLGLAALARRDRRASAAAILSDAKPRS